VVGIVEAPDAFQSFLYKFGHMENLSYFLPKNSGWTEIVAQGINDFGQIVGSGTHNGASAAFLMTPVY
jgi:hypothetical protein